MQILLPSLSSKLCLVIAMLIDSIIGSRFIGPEGMAAVKLFMPIAMADELIHSVFGSAIGIIYPRICGQNEKAKANRAYTSIIGTTLMAYLVVCGLVLLFSHDYIAFYADKPEFYQLGLDYLIPMVIALPFFEMGLLTERVFMTDGRIFFFSLRGIITILLNILFDLLFVAHWSLGTQGLALATILSTCMGYMLTLSHAFHPKNTVRLSFDIFRNKKEWWDNFKEELQIGSNYALSGIMSVVFSAILNKQVIELGGTMALFALSLLCNISNTVGSLSFSISNALILLGGILYGEKDYEGTNIVFKTACKIAIILGIFFTILAIGFAHPYIKICNVTDPATYSLCLSAICIGSLDFALYTLRRVCMQYMIILKNYSIYRFVCITDYICRIGFILIFNFLGTTAIWLIHFFSNCVLLISVLLLMKIRKQSFILKPSNSTIITFSAPLNNSTIGKLSVKAGQVVSERHHSYKLVNRLSLMIEEALTYILRKNPEDKKIHTDLRISATDKTIHISIYDDGIICNPMTNLLQKNTIDKNDLELILLKGFSSKFTYNRIAELNFTRIDVTKT